MGFFVTLFPRDSKEGNEERKKKAYFLVECFLFVYMCPLCLCLSLCLSLCHSTCVESVSFYHVGSRNQTQIIRLGGKTFTC